MKKYYLLATALAALVSCSENEFTGDESIRESNEGGAISFDLNVPAVTRATERSGAEAAGDLNNQFIIWGEKNEASGTAASEANLVFKNYKVEYTTSSAYTTTSNTKDWEYVGLTPYAGTYVSPAIEGTQSIKYWDYSATNYTFTAVSALSDDITNEKVKITKTTSGSTMYDKGYVIDVKSGANTDKIFIADRNNPTLGDGKDRTATNTRGGNVTMKFRNFMSKIRFGIYEDIPGYKVKITKVYYHSTNSTDNFGVDGKFIVPGEKTQFTVTYESANNKAIANVVGWNDGNDSNDPSTQDYFETAKDDASFPKTTVPFLSATEIGTSAPAATFNKSVQKTNESAVEDKVYTTILPFTSNNTNLKLKIDYRLISQDTGETIDITGKEVEVPSQYCQWKSNYAYSYLFKITDSDLYPITFDAVEVVDENGLAEYITTVTRPSITTFGVVLNSSSEFQNYVTGKNDYKLPGSTDKLDIYATILQGSTVLTPQKDNDNKANYVKVYYVAYNGSPSADEQTAHPITELSVANAIEHTGGLITATDITADATTYFTTAPGKVDNVPAEDGTTKTIDALKLTGVKTAGKYAVEIVTYEAVTLTSGAELNGYYSLSGDTYSKETSGTYSSGTYYKQVKTYKVITVAAAD